MTRLRVSPPRVMPVATRASRPPADPPGVADAHRQAGFVLGDELDAVLDGLNLEGAVAEASTGSKNRTQPMVAALGQWSRGWLSRLQALHAVEWGNYGAAISLIRAACDFQAAELLLLDTSAEEWNDWLDEPAITLVPESHATTYRLHAFRAAEILAAHDELGGIYRAASDLSMPHFGSTLLLAGAESDPGRVLMTFGDRDFHFGLAQLTLGWLLHLGAAKADDLLQRDGPFVVAEPDKLQRWRDRARKIAAATDRCHLEALEDADHRYLVHNWRRAPGAAPKRVLL